jgi:hypothetical protein
MKKAELQVALAGTNETAGPFLNALTAIADQAVKKDGEFVLKRLLEG